MRSMTDRSSILSFVCFLRPAMYTFPKEPRLVPSVSSTAVPTVSSSEQVKEKIFVNQESRTAKLVTGVKPWVNELLEQVDAEVGSPTPAPVAAMRWSQNTSAWVQEKEEEMVVACSGKYTCAILWNLLESSGILWMRKSIQALRWMYWTWLEWGLLSASVAGKKPRKRGRAQ